MQLEEGDLRQKSFDVFPQLIIPDLFMERKKKEENWTLFDPFEVLETYGIDLTKLYGVEFETSYQMLEESSKIRKHVVSAKSIWQAMMKAHIETGMPYMFFKDTANNYNPNKEHGIIPCGNLCMESFSPVKPDEYTHVCNLVSLVLGRIEEEEEKHLASLAVWILDTSIDLTQCPTKIGQKHNEDYRVIGVGFMGLADWLAKNQRNYNTGLADAQLLFDRMSRYVIDASCHLAVLRGVYPKFEGSEWEKGNLLGHPWEETVTRATALGTLEEWDALRTRVESFGIRNGQLLAIAPNTSTALLQGATASILPPYNLFFHESNAKAKIPVAPPYMGDSFHFYQANVHFNQKDLVTFIAVAIAPYIDSGISMELNFNQNLDYVNPRFVSDTLMLAWELKCKTVYYVRWVTKKNEDIPCIPCAG